MTSADDDEITARCAEHNTVIINGRRVFKWAYDHSNQRVVEIMTQAWARGAVFGAVLGCVVSAGIWFFLTVFLKAFVIGGQ